MINFEELPSEELQEKLNIARIKAEYYRKKYYQAHKYCPKCGGISHSSTYVGYLMDIENPENYKDLNNCICSDCGNKHTVHERIGNKK